MTNSPKAVRTFLALFGVVVLLATTVVTLGTTRPTEAQWADEVYGTSVFHAVPHPDDDKTFARTAGPYGEVIRVAGNSSALGADPTTVAYPDTVSRVEDPKWTSVRAGTAFLAAGERFNCARRDNSGDDCSLTGHEDPDAQSFAVAQVQDFRSRILVLVLPLRLARFAYDQPAVATAACTPGQIGKAALSGGPLTLGSGLGSEDFPLPEPGGYTELDRSILGYDYEGYLHHDYEVRDNYARSQLRLYLQATGDLTNLNPWTLHVILAHAECGTRMDPPPPPSRPGLDDPRGATLAGNRVARSEPSATSSPAEVETTTETRASELTPTAPTTTAPSTTAPTTTSPQAATTPRTSAPAATSPQASVPTTAAREAEGPSTPQTVSPGRWFTVTTREGVDLGRTRIEDVQRDPECGVELSLSITTSDEVGPDGWSSIGRDDFAEVGPGGSTSDVQPVSADCEQAPDSGSTALSPDSDYEIVIAFHLSDSATRAMWRPEGTAGWIFDLPTPTTTSAATTTPTTTAAATTTATAEA